MFLLKINLHPLEVVGTEIHSIKWVKLIKDNLAGKGLLGSSGDIVQTPSQSATSTRVTGACTTAGSLNIKCLPRAAIANNIVKLETKRVYNLTPAQ